MDDFLEQTQGGREAEPGVFTVASSKVADKMGRYLLPETEMWVLKVVQAAVRASATQLDFRFGRSKTEVRLVGGQEWSLAELKASLQELGHCRPSHNELLLALRSLAPTHDLRMTCDTGEQLRVLDGELFSAAGANAGCRLQIEVRTRKPESSFRKRLRTRLHNHASCAQWLQKRARFAPLHLRVDGRTISSAKYDCKPRKPAGLYADKQFETPLLWARLDAGNPSSDLSVANKQILSDPLMSERFFATVDQPGQEASQSHLLLVANCVQNYRAKPHLEDAPFAENVWFTLTKPSNFYLHFSRFGVVCDSLEARAPLGGELHLPCDHLEAGITGLGRREQLDLLPDGLAYLRSLRPLVEELRARIRAHQPSTTLPKPNLKGVAATAVILGSATLGFSAFWGLGLAAASKVGLATGSGVSAVNSLRLIRLDRDGVEEIARAVELFQSRAENNGLDFRRC